MKAKTPPLFEPNPFPPFTKYTARSQREKKLRKKDCLYSMPECSQFESFSSQHMRCCLLLDRQTLKERSPIPNLPRKKGEKVFLWEENFLAPPTRKKSQRKPQHQVLRLKEKRFSIILVITRGFSLPGSFCFFYSIHLFLYYKKAFDHESCQIIQESLR